MQGEGSVAAWRNAFDDEMASAVGACDAQQRLGAEYRVGRVGLVESHGDALHGFEVFRLQNIAADLHRVDFPARRKAVSITAKWVALVVVGDGVGKVDGIGCVGLERVFQFHENRPARRLDFRQFHLRRRHDDFLRRIVDFDEFVEENPYFLRVHTCSLVSRRSTEHARRLFVEPSAVGTAHSGATAQKKRTEQRKE